MFEAGQYNRNTFYGLRGHAVLALACRWRLVFMARKPILGRSRFETDTAGVRFSSGAVLGL